MKQTGTRKDEKENARQDHLGYMLVKMLLIMIPCVVLYSLAGRIFMDNIGL